MAAAWPILASGEESLVKLAIGVIVAIIWVCVQVYQKLAEKGDKRLPPSRPKPQGNRMPPSRPLPQDPPITGRSTQQTMRERPPQRRPQKQAPPPVPRRPVRVETMVVAPPLSRSISTPPSPLERSPIASSDAPARASGKTMPRKQVIGALLKPRNLKKAIALTEILGPPVAMRGDVGR